MKRVRLNDELVSDVLVECCLNSGDSWYETYLGKCSGNDGDDGGKEKEWEVLLNWILYVDGEYYMTSFTLIILDV